MSKPFEFKQFTIHQDKCAMKVGTDGVLLGAWATISKSAFSCLDIGAGTGLLSLMIAQRSAIEVIDAIEIDDNAYEQCVQNFENSKWNDRLFCYHASFDEFVDEIEDKYDLIISNPPFYREEISSGDKGRDQARQSASLPFEVLIKGVSHLLSESGCFQLIIPYKEEDNFIKLAHQKELFLQRITRVRGTTDSDIKRSLLEFSRVKANHIEKQILTIEKGRHNYTNEYINATKDFYLKM